MSDYLDKNEFISRSGLTRHADATRRVVEESRSREESSRVSRRLPSWKKTSARRARLHDVIMSRRVDL